MNIFNCTLGLQKKSSCGVDLFETAGNQVRFRNIPKYKKIELFSAYKKARLLARRIAACAEQV